MTEGSGEDVAGGIISLHGTEASAPSTANTNEEAGPGSRRRRWCGPGDTTKVDGGGDGGGGDEKVESNTAVLPRALPPSSRRGPRRWETRPSTSAPAPPDRKHALLASLALLTVLHDKPVACCPPWPFDTPSTP